MVRRFSLLFGLVLVALCASLVALVLGTLLAIALSRYKFFGRQAVGLMVILPIALPGIVTGLALNNAFRTVLLDCLPAFESRHGLKDGERSIAHRA